VGTGVLPLQPPAGTAVESLGITGTEAAIVRGVEGTDPASLLGATLTAHIGAIEVPVTVRLDTPMEAAYYHHGGILPHVLRHHLATAAS
jgi:aconitate hydratase